VYNFVLREEKYYGKDAQTGRLASLIITNYEFLIRSYKDGFTTLRPRLI